MITLTQKALNHINECLLKRGKGFGIRINIKSSGCSGMSYKFEYLDNILTEDIVFEVNNIKIATDSKSLLYINGLEIDFITEKLISGFKFNNPNVKSVCGCGESFNI